jgi:hypothetical protein
MGGQVDCHDSHAQFVQLGQIAFHLNLLWGRPGLRLSLFLLLPRSWRLKMRTFGLLTREQVFEECPLERGEVPAATWPRVDRKAREILRPDDEPGASP